MTKTITICIAAALLTVTAAHGETVGQLYEKAKAEKSLVFYAAGPAANKGGVR